MSHEEIWKPIPDYPGYEVSNRGRVRSLWKRIHRGGQAGFEVILSDSPIKILKGTAAGRYLSVILCKNRTYKRIVIQKLVLWAFVGPAPFGQIALHKDDKPHHNYLENLYWGTYQDNYTDKKNNSGVPQQKLSDNQVDEIRQLRSNGVACKKIASMFNIVQQYVYDITNWRVRPWQSSSGLLRKRRKPRTP
jgi:hypothetical protein